MRSMWTLPRQQDRVIEPETVRRIAILRALQLGDLLVAVPAFRAIRARFPEAEITLIGLPWAEWFVERFSAYLDRFVEFGGYQGIQEVPFEAERSRHFLTVQRRAGYDLVIQMHGSGQTSNKVVRDIRGEITAGYYEGVRPEWLDIAARYPDEEPEVLRNLGLARLLGCPDRGTHLEFPLTDADRAEAECLLDELGAGDRLLVGMHPGARPPARRWPPERFAAVADHVAGSYGARVVLTGGPGEEDLVAAVAARMRREPFNIAGRTTIGGLAALIARMDLFISNDTGPAHLARAVDTPSVTVFGPADFRRWAPLDRQRHQIVRQPVLCSPCGYWECPIDHRCLQRIEPGMVIEAAERFIERGVVACDD